MRKILILFAVIGLVFLAAGCKKPKKKGNQEGATPPAQEEQKDDGLFKGSFRDLMKMGKSMKCEIVYSDQEMESTSMIYVSDNKIRNDVEVKDADGKTIVSHTIIDGDWMYLWTDGQKQGTKMKIEEQQAEQPEVPEEVEANLQHSRPQESEKRNLDEEFDYKCSPWIVDNSKFIPPTNIEFVDYSAVMEEMQMQAEEAKKEACQMCDDLPEPAKSQCLQGCQ